MNLPDFDPIAFLGITNIKDKEKVTIELLKEISNYLVTRFIEILPTEIVIYQKSQEDVFVIAQKQFPDFDHKVQAFIKDFRIEYLQNQ